MEWYAKSLKHYLAITYKYSDIKNDDRSIIKADVLKQNFS